MTTAPEEIHGVSDGYFSIARHYGGCTVFGAAYTYDPTRDVLIRDDVLRRRVGEAKAAKRRAKQQRIKESGTKDMF